MMNDIEIAINKIAQGIIPIEEGMDWFASASEEFKSEIMRTLGLCMFQSHPNEADIENGIVKSELKETYSPCVLIRKKPFNEVLQKVLNMSGLDQMRSFKLLVTVFSVADERRRNKQCIGGCTHDWHNL
jgi:hypothetical protein